MARKFESIPETITRLYKNGYSIERIAKEVGMPKDNVPKILERHMPDYQNYVQPSTPVTNDSSNSKKSFFNNSVGDLFKKKPKAVTEVKETAPVEPKSTPASDPVKSSINLTMSENGFVDGTVRGIASMLQNGKDVSTIADFFSRDEDDIIAVRERMDEHFKRVNSSSDANTDVEEPEDNNSALYSARGNMMYASGLEDMGSVSPSASSNSDFSMPSLKPVSHSSEPEILEEMPSIDKESLAQLDQQIEEFNKQVKNTTVMTDDIPAVETPEIFPPINTPAEEKTVEEKITDADTETKINDNAEKKEEDSSMTPMEKMRKFAEEQIELNNKKIEELKEKRAEAENSSLEADNKLDVLLNEIEELQKKVAELKNQSETLAEEKSKAKSVLDEIDVQIAEIEKENEEFMSYCR